MSLPIVIPEGDSSITIEQVGSGDVELERVLETVSINTDDVTGDVEIEFAETTESLIIDC